MAYQPTRRSVVWAAVAVAAVAVAGLAWARATSGPSQTSTVVASAEEAQFDPADLSLDGPIDVSPGAAPGGLGSPAREVSKPVLQSLPAATALAVLPTEVVVPTEVVDAVVDTTAAVESPDDPASVAAAGVGAAASAPDVARGSEPERSDAGIGDVRGPAVDATPSATPSATRDATPSATPSDAGSDAADQRSADGAASYTYWEGDSEITVWLVPQTAARDVGPKGGEQGLADSKAGSKSGSSTSQVRRSAPGTGLGAPPGQLVFRTATGSQMWLPGGVLLVLDAAWSTAQADAFFAQNDIDAGRVAEFDWLDNGFLIETGPGLVSLELANRLVGQQGVELSSPNWSVEAELK